MPMCTRCFQPLLEGRISLDASGPGFTLTVTSVPAYSCDTCGTSLRLDETAGPEIRAIVVTVMNGLESLAPVARGEPRYSTLHCRECKAKLPSSVDKRRSHFTVSASLERGGPKLGIEYFGDSVTCPACFVKHPHLPATLYHQVGDSIARAASHYTA